VLMEFVVLFNAVGEIVFISEMKSRLVHMSTHELSMLPKRSQILELLIDRMQVHMVTVAVLLLRFVLGLGLIKSWQLKEFPIINSFKILKRFRSYHFRSLFLRFWLS